MKNKTINMDLIHSGKTFQFYLDLDPSYFQGIHPPKVDFY